MGPQLLFGTIQVQRAGQVPALWPGGAENSGQGQVSEAATAPSLPGLIFFILFFIVIRGAC
jgi:hypothetical protein